MKKLIFLLGTIITHSLSAQITLKECIESGMANRSNIRMARNKVFLANLKSFESKTKYLPQLELAYDYRYNPMVATQIVPVGQFSPIPTDQTRAIRFGTTWQQNAGISLYQSLINHTIKSRIKESKINESIATIDLKKMEEEVTFEIVKSFCQIIILGSRVDEAAMDTLRSFHSLKSVNTKYREGKVLKSDLNSTIINHNENVMNMKKALALLISEKIYLHYLTNISLERIMDGNFTPITDLFYAGALNAETTKTDAVPDFQRLELKKLLTYQQIKTERKKYAPIIGFQGFLGANQFSTAFDPFSANSWFGNSYIGLNIKLPILTADKSFNGAKQLQTELLIIDDQKQDLLSKTRKELLQKTAQIESTLAEISLIKKSVDLQSQNVRLLRERFENGQLEATELNREETGLQKLSIRLYQLEQQSVQSLMERLYLSGRLSEKIKSL